MITPADLLAPVGPIEIGFFPGEDTTGDSPPNTILEDRLQEYIDQATAKVSGIAFTDVDEAVTLWALHLSFKAAYLVSVSRPSTENTQVAILGSQGYARDQRDALLLKSEEYADLYKAALVAVPTTATPLGIPSRSTSLSFEW